MTSDLWKQHLDQYGSKVKNEKKLKKSILIDLGLGFHQKETVTLNQTTKRHAITSSTSNESRKRKKDFIDSFRAPRKLAVEILPVLW